MDALEPWSEFNVAMAGATAALAGLVIVAASVNIGEIVAARALTARLGAAIAALVLALVGSAMGLVPGIPAPVYGLVVVIGAVGAGAFALEATRQIYAHRDPANRARPAKAAAAFATPAVYAVGGALVAAGLAAGLFLFAIGAFVAIVTALLVSWIVLVEVLR